MSKELIRRETAFSLQPTNLNEAMQFADIISKSDLVPKDYKGRPGNVLVAVQMGAEIGLSPMQALQNIAVINGRPSVWGDAAMALVQAHPDCEDVIEECDGKAATCTVKRRGRQPVVSRFSMDDAKRAGLLGKQGPWTQYPARMLQLRARGFALRDSFADALKGLITAEEASDYNTPPPQEPKRQSGRVSLKEPKAQEPPPEDADYEDVPPPKQTASISEWEQRIGKATTIGALHAIGAEIAALGSALPDDAREILQAQWKRRKESINSDDAKREQAAQQAAEQAFADEEPPPVDENQGAFGFGDQG